MEPARRRPVWVTLTGAAIVLHFTLILLVVTHAEEWIRKRPEVPFRLLVALIDADSTITFTDRNFGFFAPDVTSDWNVAITMTDEEGRQSPIHFRTPNREMKVRTYSMCGHFAETSDNMDLFARSWAVKAMNENPDIVRVDVEVTQNDVPTMAGWRQGKRIEPQPLYRTTFTLR